MEKLLCITISQIIYCSSFSSSGSPSDTVGKDDKDEGAPRQRKSLDAAVNSGHIKTWIRPSSVTKICRPLHAQPLPPASLSTLPPLSSPLSHRLTTALQLQSATTALLQQPPTKTHLCFTCCNTQYPGLVLLYYTQKSQTFACSSFSNVRILCFSFLFLIVN